MVSTPGQRSLVIWESKIIHKSPIFHPLARFVTEETAALLFNIQPEQIYKITCLRYVVHVHSKGVSRFVSYADFPAILGVKPPTPEDFVRWRKRWKRKSGTAFWTKFYTQQFKRASSVEKLQEWGKLVSLVKSVLSETALQELRQVYKREKFAWESF